MRAQVQKASKGVQARLGGHVILAPEWLMKQWPKQVVVRFGLRRAQAEVHSLPLEVESTADGEWRLELGSELCEQLLMPEDLKCRVDVRDGEVWIGPVMGLLLGEQRYVYHDSNMGEHTDAMAYYEQTGGLVIACKLSSINWEKRCVHGLFYHPSKKRWEYGLFPLPSVVHLRAFNLGGADLARLKAATGGQVFNSVRYDKWELYQLLREHPVLQPHLPQTELAASAEVVEGFLQTFGRVILKPRGLSRARGILLLERLREEASLRVVDYSNGKHKTTYTAAEANLADFLRQKRILRGTYIVQPWLQLATIDGSPFDIRVVMQKNETLTWQCTGIECRHAGKSDLITNISRGGQALEIRKAAQLSFGPRVDVEQFVADVLALSQRFVEAMDGIGEHFSEFGLDVAVDTEQRLWLIEANVRPTFNGFRKMDLATYEKVSATPLLYAAALAYAKRWGG